MRPVQNGDRVRTGSSEFAADPNAVVLDTKYVGPELVDVRCAPIAGGEIAWWNPTRVFRIGDNGEIIDARGNERCAFCLSWDWCPPYCEAYCDEPDRVQCTGSVRDGERCPNEATHSELASATADVVSPMCDSCCGAMVCARGKVGSGADVR